MRPIMTELTTQVHIILPALFIGSCGPILRPVDFLHLPVHSIWNSHVQRLFVFSDVDAFS